MAEAHYTPEIIQHLAPNEVFIFGSNLNGAHMGGAARVAHARFGAQWGEGEGLMGQSYALPTLDRQMHRVSASALRESFQRLLVCVQSHPQLTFYLTKVGCGIAGWRESEVRQLLWEAWAKILGGDPCAGASIPLPSNLVIPREFC